MNFKSISLVFATTLLSSIYAHSSQNLPEVIKLSDGCNGHHPREIRALAEQENKLALSFLESENNEIKYNNELKEHETNEKKFLEQLEKNKLDKDKLSKELADYKIKEEEEGAKLSRDEKEGNEFLENQRKINEISEKIKNITQQNKNFEDNIGKITLEKNKIAEKIKKNNQEKNDRLKAKEIKQKELGNQKEKWQKQIFALFEQKKIENGFIFSQIKAWVLNEVLSETMSVEEGRSIKNFWQKKINDIYFLREVFEGHKGDNVALPTVQVMKDPPPKTGKHLALVRQVRELTNPQDKLGVQNNGEGAINQDRDIKQKQEKADLYALTKYTIYINAYSSLPQQDSKVEEEYKFESIASELIPYLTQLFQERGNEGSKYGAKKAVEREYNKVSKKITDMNIIETWSKIIDQNTKFSEKILADKLTEIVKQIIKQNNLESGKNFVEAVDKDNTKYSWYTFNQETDIITIAQTYRADLLIFKKAEKWRGKIPTESGLMERLGLKSALFNPHFDKTLVSEILNINLLGENIGTYAEKLKTISWPQLWSTCVMQFRENYFEAFSNDDNATMNRVNPIYKFVTAKAREEEDGEEKAFNQLKDLPDKKEKAGRFALSQYVSYMSMNYALSHDEKGTTLQPLNLYSPVLKNYINQGLEKIEEISVNQVMAAQAYVWGQHLLNDCSEFVEQKALKSWMLKEKNEFFRKKPD